MESLYGGALHRRVTIADLAAAKSRGEKWAMLTSYEQMTAEILLTNFSLRFDDVLALDKDEQLIHVVRDKV